MYIRKIHTHFQGQTQKRVGNITYNTDKLNYTINILLIRAVYGSIEDFMELEKTLGTRPLLFMMLHTATKKKKCTETAKYLIDRCLFSIYSRKMIRLKEKSP